MLKSEFIEGTHLPDDQLTNRMYIAADLIYMKYDEMTKDTIYSVFKSIDEFVTYDKHQYSVLEYIDKKLDLVSDLWETYKDNLTISKDTMIEHEALECEAMLKFAFHFNMISYELYRVRYDNVYNIRWLCINSKKVDG